MFTFDDFNKYPSFALTWLGVIATFVTAVAYRVKILALLRKMRQGTASTEEVIEAEEGVRSGAVPLTAASHILGEAERARTQQGGAVKATMDDARARDQFFLAARGALAAGGLTPLQVQEIEQAIEAQNQSDADWTALEEQKKQIELHWQDYNVTMMRKGGCMNFLRLHASSLVELLLEEYYEIKPPQGPVDLKDYDGALNSKDHRLIATGVFGTKEQRREAAVALTSGDEEGLEPLYAKAISKPIKEMLLDRDHVEQRLRMAVAGANYTQAILMAGDVSRFETVIQKDLALLRQVLLVRPDLRKYKDMLSLKSQDMLKRASSTPGITPQRPQTPPPKGLWTSIRNNLKIPKSSPQLSQSLSSACLLSSDEGLAKEEI
nr:hypothetical protein CFP56_50800 [Quercus suber]